MTDRTTQKVTAGTIVDVVLPLFLLSLLVALCIQLLVPFVGLLVWTIIPVSYTHLTLPTTERV